MILNSKNAAKFVEESQFSKRAQNGIDLTIQKINELNYLSEHAPVISKDKSHIGPYTPIEPDENGFFLLMPGRIYDLVFNEKIELDSKHSALIIQRSSLSRSGLLITHKSYFDPGFKSKPEFIGTTGTCFIGGKIEKNARIAQMLIFETEEVENTYNGQYQSEKQRIERGL